MSDSRGDRWASAPSRGWGNWGLLKKRVIVLIVMVLVMVLVVMVLMVLKRTSRERGFV